MLVKEGESAALSGAKTRRNVGVFAKMGPSRLQLSTKTWARRPSSLRTNAHASMATIVGSPWGRVTSASAASTSTSGYPRASVPVGCRGAEGGPASRRRAPPASMGKSASKGGRRTRAFHRRSVSRSSFADGMPPPPIRDTGDDDGGGRPDDLPVPVLVETAMLSALTGLLFHLSTLFRLDAYFGALFPLPIVIACARNGTKAASRVAIVTSMLLFLISGPMRAVNYFCLHGAMAYALSWAWWNRCSWWVSVPLSAAVRSLGIFASLTFTSLVLRENVMQLMVTQMMGLLDQIAANIGMSWMPTLGWVWGMALFFVLLNSLSYVVILHAVFTILLRACVPQGDEFVNAPKKIRKMLLGPNATL